MTTSTTTCRVRRRRRGISLLELAIVALIIGILASMSLPSFQRGLEQSRTDLAAANLRAIWTAQRIYWLEHRVYAADLPTLMADDLLDHAVTELPSFSFNITQADANTFTAVATRDANARWNGALSIDQTGTLLGSLACDGLPDIVPTYH